MTCEKCRAGQMVEYERKILSRGKEVLLKGRKCDRCGFTQLDNDDDVWSAVGL
jgi:predicted Zn-ribbon and HTH transcriptional regulator